jgi:hypothetical protein
VRYNRKNKTKNNLNDTVSSLGGKIDLDDVGSANDEEEAAVAD